MCLAVFLLCILGKLYGCQNSESWIMCCMYSFKRTLFMSLAFLEAEHTSNDVHIYFPYLCSFLLTGLLVLIRIQVIDVHPRNSYRCFSLSSLIGAGRLRSCKIATFLVYFLHPLQQCWLLRSWLTQTKFTISGSLVWHTFLVNLHDLAFTHGHLGQFRLCLGGLSNTVWSWL